MHKVLLMTQVLLCIAHGAHSANRFFFFFPSAQLQEHMTVLYHVSFSVSAFLSAARAIYRQLAHKTPALERSE